LEVEEEEEEEGRLEEEEEEGRLEEEEDCGRSEPGEEKEEEVDDPLMFIVGAGEEMGRGCGLIRSAIGG
jgi:hypothetical protein